LEVWGPRRAIVITSPRAFGPRHPKRKKKKRNNWIEDERSKGLIPLCPGTEDLEKGNQAVLKTRGIIDRVSRPCLAWRDEPIFGKTEKGKKKLLYPYYKSRLRSEGRKIKF